MLSMLLPNNNNSHDNSSIAALPDCFCEVLITGNFKGFLWSYESTDN